MNRRKIRAYEYDTIGRLGLSYSNLGKARNYDYDGMGNRIGFREYGSERKGFGENGLKSIGELNLPRNIPVYEERYVLDRTKPYNNMLQRNIVERGKNKDHVQNYVWDFNTLFMEEEEKAYTYLSDELGSPVRLFEQDGENQTIYGYDEFGNDTYGTQEQVQPFGYTGYRYDTVAGTYFAQAREYVPKVGRFVGEDWIKGSTSYPASLNQYGYCFGNPFGLVDYDGKNPRTALANPSNATPMARQKAEKDILKSENSAPYVGVFYLNIESGAFGNGHAAMMLLRGDDTGDLYSFVGDANSTLTILWGYNDANVNYAYAVDVGSVLNEKKDRENYKFLVGNRENRKIEDEYNRAIYFPITNESEQEMADAAKEIILKTNGVGHDEQDYHLLVNNCDQNARRWMEAGGIRLETGGHIVPNLIYDYNVG